jgi:hypothetical protein
LNTVVKYKLFVKVLKKNGHVFWHEIGAAQTNKQGFVCFFDSAPRGEEVYMWPDGDAEIAKHIHDEKIYLIKSPRYIDATNTKWHSIGMAWNNEKGFNLKLNSIPLPNNIGKVQVQFYVLDQKKDDKVATKQLVSDEIPF